MCGPVKGGAHVRKRFIIHKVCSDRPVPCLRELLLSAPQLPTSAGFLAAHAQLLKCTELQKLSWGIITTKVSVSAD